MFFNKNYFFKLYLFDILLLCSCGKVVVGTLLIFLHLRSFLITDCGLTWISFKLEKLRRVFFVNKHSVELCLVCQQMEYTVYNSHPLNPEAKLLLKYWIPVFQSMRNQSYLRVVQESTWYLGGRSLRGISQELEYTRYEIEPVR